MNRDPQTCTHCHGAVEDAENWVLDRHAGYMHEACAESYDADLAERDTAIRLAPAAIGTSPDQTEHVAEAA